MSNIKRKCNFKKFILLVITICLVIYFLIKNNYIFSDYFNISNFENISNYKTIKLDENKNYSGIGQEKIYNEDGYFTTFTTIDSNKKVYKEYKQNGNSSWSKKDYVTKWLWYNYYGYYIKWIW